jgi:ribosomal protein S18 acetylase RimI-like enzyme
VKDTSSHIREKPGGSLNAKADPIRVRPAGRKDAERITDLYCEVGDEAVAREPTLRRSPERHAVLERYQRRLRTAGVFVAKVREEIVGFVDADLTPPVSGALARTDVGAVYVSELAVSHGQRRRGVARQLMAAVETWAEKGGAGTVYLDTHLDNDAARRLYAALGYREIGVVLVKSVRDV